LQAFLSNSHQNIDPSLLGDLLNALFKILALDTGSHLAYLYLTLFDQKPSEEFWTVLDKQLTSGI
jgi:hypothetical protein